MRLVPENDEERRMIAEIERKSGVTDEKTISLMAMRFLEWAVNMHYIGWILSAFFAHNGVEKWYWPKSPFLEMVTRNGMEFRRAKVQEAVALQELNRIYRLDYPVVHGMRWLKDLTPGAAKIVMEAGPPKSASFPPGTRLATGPPRTRGKVGIYLKDQ